MSEERMPIGEWAARPWDEPWSDVPAVLAAAAAVTEIGIERGMSYGPCPVYSVRLDRAGKAWFVGEHFVDMMGPHEASIDPDNVRTLALAIVCLGFEQLQSNYSVDYTDASTTYTWLARGSQRVGVEDYGGAGPSELRAIENLIDAAASELPWQSQGSTTSLESGRPLFAGLDVPEEWRHTFDGGNDRHWTQARHSSR